ncbi:MAG TPA: fatty acid desaturase [Gemmatimonadaceae bacterium]
MMQPLTNGDAAVAPPTADATTQEPHWRDVVAPYQQSDVTRSIIQLVVTVVLLAGGFVAMAYSMYVSYWLTLLLAIPTAGLLVRSFILMHDCTHSSFLPWRKANDLVGWFTGLLTLTPFDQWRRDHAIHHASSGDLDRRGHGDVHTITVREYQALTAKGRLAYRLVRNPVAMLLVGPLYLMYSHRFRPRSIATKDKQVSSVMSTNLAIVAVMLGMYALGVLPQFLMIYFPALYLAGVAGVFLFYVQHQFEDTYWESHGAWDYQHASLAGSSYLQLPRPLAWITGDIGVHHVHHISPKIPNYKLQQCHDENPIFHKVTTLRLRDTFKTLRLSLWDEDQGKLISFRELGTKN